MIMSSPAIKMVVKSVLRHLPEPIKARVRALPEHQRDPNAEADDHFPARESGDEVCVVAATGVARDWIRNNAWRRIGELWAQNDPLGRRLDLKSRLDLDNRAAATVAPAVTPAPSVALVGAFKLSEPPPTVIVVPAAKSRFVAIV